MPRPLRLIAAGFLSGLVGGAAAGVGARLVMFAVRVANPAFNGSVTHQSVVNGRWTVEGTMAVVLTGVFFGFIGGPLYLVVRPALGRRRVVRGVLAGVLLLIGFGSDVLDGDYEFSRFVSPRVSVSAFAALFVLYGLVLALVADAIAPPSPSRHPWMPRIGFIVVFVVAAAGMWQLAERLRFRYQF